nr:hypothetical protein [candidate division Zixibacteria bacterium]NIT61979.1 hypothetical protein [Fodinibius sp.]NIW40079.1 hypothetical protein [candidate division Zixibacteria bacterium]NIX58937.1 hypothetical protein [candidate division Zixibacteria bacterium]NIY30559.1 hypothetical protein [Fodinibius sp.]
MRTKLSNMRWILVALFALVFILVYCGGEEQAGDEEGYLEETPKDTVVTATPLPNEVFIDDNA